MTGIQGVSSSLWLPISQSTSGKRPRSEGTTESNGGKEDNDKDIDEENVEDNDKDNERNFQDKNMMNDEDNQKENNKGNDDNYDEEKGE